MDILPEPVVNIDNNDNETDKNLPVAVTPDPDIKEVYSKLLSIVSKGFEDTMFKAGQYLIDIFYGGNSTLAQNDKDKTGLNSLNQYIKNLNDNNPNAPKKSWIYNAVKLVIEHEIIKEHSKQLFHAYGKLSLSHKVLLFPVQDMAHKTSLIEHAGENQPTVIEFRQKIAETKPKNNRKLESTPSLLKIISNPEQLLPMKCQDY